MSTALTSLYPATPGDRDRWILDRRPQRNHLDPYRPYAYFIEDEHSATGEVLPIATILLTNRECPYRCLMCDLWKNTLPETVPTGAIPAQIDYALAQLPPARQIKLYNSGSFFDPRAIPASDHAAIATQVKAFERVIVECHPSLIAESCYRFHDRIGGKLEVAMGLETAHAPTLEKLNKRMTLEHFAAAAEKLRAHSIALRVFILVKPPFMEEDQSLVWAKKSLDFAFHCGATAATLIPTRAGNGAMDELSQSGNFAPPRLSTIEAAAAYGLSRKQGRVFTDLWDTQLSDNCPYCHPHRLERLRTMNLTQRRQAPIRCHPCGGSSD